MKTLGGVLLVAACLVACANSFPGAREDDSDERRDVDPFFRPVAFDIPDPDEEMSLIYKHMYRWYSRMKDLIRGMVDPDIFEGPFVEIPKGANTTSTTKVIDGHVVVINETTYSGNEDGFKTVLRVSVVDVRPQDETGKPEDITVSPVAEDTDIPKNEVETLDA
ncbi:icarapin-like [Augochlora pura]